MLEKFSFIAENKDVTLQLKKELKKALPQIFSIPYASLNINTDDPETEIYINSNYAGKGSVYFPYLIPQNYVITLKKDGFEEKTVNLRPQDFEDKTINIKLDKEVEMQTVYFHIEPLGTQVFLNSIYQGTTPFKKALPKGRYIMTVKHKLYQNFRYVFNIEHIISQDLNILFHLQTRNLEKEHKRKKWLYYASFWNFTFSLTATVPIVVIAYRNFYRSSALFSSDSVSSEINTQTYYNLYLSSYVLAFVFGAYTVLSMGWLFFALARYLLSMEKKDFIPILDFYKKQDGEELLTIGMSVNLPQRKEQTKP
ncbi:MAG: PEGA domain-containing protein [Spirochaetes bacterium]|nr:PEGA domain-containing protein [Spirochaetota bacterium]